MFARNALPTRTRAAMSENKLSFGHGFCSWNILLFHYAGKSFGRAYFQSKSRIKCCQKLFFSADRGTKSSGATGSVDFYYSTYADQQMRLPAESITSADQALTCVDCYYSDSYFTDAQNVFTVGETSQHGCRRSRGMRFRNYLLWPCREGLNSYEQRNCETILRAAYGYFSD